MELDHDRINFLFKNAEVVPITNVPGTKTNFFDTQLRYIISECLGWDASHRTLGYALKSVHDLKDGKLYLRGEWADETAILVGEHVNLVSPKRVPNTNLFLIDGEQGFVVVCPDNLISVTSVSTATFCSRKTVFNDRFRLPFDSIDAFRGVIAHELLGRALLKDIQNVPSLKILLHEVLSSATIMAQAYGLALTQKKLTQLGNELIPFVVRLIRRNMDENIVEALDIEDNYWNPIYGLKGKLDATVKYFTENGPLMTPLEFKTGNLNTGNVKPSDPKRKRDVNHNHVAQVLLYTLLMSRRYENVKTGLLLYIRENEISPHSASHRSLKHLMLSRNRLVISESIVDGKLSRLDVPSVDFHSCKGCEFKTTCSALVRNGGLKQRSTNTEKSLDEYCDSNLNEQELNFFMKWFTIITVETEAIEQKFNVKSLWTLSLDEREKSGKCIANLQLVKSVRCDNVDLGFNGMLVTFKRDKPSQTGPEFFVKLDIQERDFVVLGTHDELCISYASVYEIDPVRQTITLSMESLIKGAHKDESTRYTVDMVSGTSPIMAQYGYLQKLMDSNPDSRKLRATLIKKKPVTLDTRNPTEIMRYRVVSSPKYNFNKHQQAAILGVVQSSPYICIHGMPGTGKTHTIAGILELLKKMGKSVLVTAFTGQALDNVLEAYYRWTRADFLRIGEPKLKNESIMERNTTHHEKYAPDVDELANIYDDTNIVGTTLLNLKHPIFRRRKFDYVIIDEASQALPSAAFGALLLAKKFVLVGDPEQLPSVVQGKSVKLIRHDDSIYNMLATEENTVRLRHQYRMNGPIMDLANKLVYNGTMTCDEITRDTTLMLTSSPCCDIPKYLEKYTGELLECLTRLASERVEDSVLWFDTSNVDAYDSRKDDSLVNEHEVKMIVEFVKLYVNALFTPSFIGVIAPYRGQVQALKTKIYAAVKQIPKHSRLTEVNNVSISTVDQFQGQERNVIICSFTKSRPLGAANEFEGDFLETKGGILQDMRRLNVAITRAKAKLIMVGNMSYLRSKFSPFEEMAQVLTEDQVYQLKTLLV